MINKVNYGCQNANFGANLRIKGNLKGLSNEQIAKLTERAKRIGSPDDEIVVNVGKYLEGKKIPQRSMVAATNINGQLDAYDIATPHFNRTLDKPYEYINIFLTKLMNTLK